MKEQSLSLEDTTIRQQCKHLRMPTIGLRFRKLAPYIWVDFLFLAPVDPADHRRLLR
jgi:hypothetical protein